MKEKNKLNTLEQSINQHLRVRKRKLNKNYNKNNNKQFIYDTITTTTNK